MTLSTRERRLIGLLAIVLVVSLGARVWFQRAGQAQGQQDLEELFASPTPAVVVPAPTASPTFSIPLDARDPFSGK